MSGLEPAPPVEELHQALGGEPQLPGGLLEPVRGDRLGHRLKQPQPRRRERRIDEPGADYQWVSETIVDSACIGRRQSRVAFQSTLSRQAVTLSP